MDITSHFGVIQNYVSQVWRKLREIKIKVTYHCINSQVLVRSCMVCDFQLVVGVDQQPCRMVEFVWLMIFSCTYRRAIQKRLGDISVEHKEPRY